MFAANVVEHGATRIGVPLLGDHHVVAPIGKPLHMKISTSLGTYPRVQVPFLLGEGYIHPIQYRVTGGLFSAIGADTIPREVGSNTCPRDVG